VKDALGRTIRAGDVIVYSSPKHGTIPALVDAVGKVVAATVTASTEFGPRVGDRVEVGSRGPRGGQANNVIVVSSGGRPVALDRSRTKRWDHGCPD
jgi:hypothetical protein